MKKTQTLSNDQVMKIVYRTVADILNAYADWLEKHSDTDRKMIIAQLRDGADENEAAALVLQIKEELFID